MNALVIPSNRPEQLTEFFKAWGDVGGWDCVYLMEDAPYATRKMVGAASYSNFQVQHLSHNNVERDLGDKAWIISKKDSACRSYGFYKAWQDNAEYILTLDDDVRPLLSSNLLSDHVDAMTRAKRFKSSVQGLWPRGMPDCQVFRDDVKASVGLWRGVPDLYAEDMLNGYPTDYKPPLGTRILPDGEFIPICGMNLCIHRDAVPLCWFPLMGEGQSYSRFDDIWAGLVLKRGFDILGWKVSVGEPHVHHSRASDPIVCAERESSGKGVVNDSLWKCVSKPGYVDAFDNAGEVMTAISVDINLLANQSGNEYFTLMAKGMRTWASLFKG